MKTNKRIARGFFRLVFTAGIAISAVGATIEIAEGRVASGLVGGALFIAASYLLGLLVAWIVRGFGKDESDEVGVRKEQARRLTKRRRKGGRTRQGIGWALIVLGGTSLLTIPGGIRTMGLYSPGGTFRGAMVGGAVLAFLCGVVIVIGILVLRSGRNREQPVDERELTAAESQSRHRGRSRTNEPIARGLFRLVLSAGITLGVVIVVDGIVHDDVSFGLLVGAGFGVGGYVLALSVAWVVRGFGKNGSDGGNE